MTTEERRLRDIEWRLEEDTCHCGATPELITDPGVTVIRCPRGCMQVVLPDFRPEVAFKLWIEKLQQPIKK